MKKVLSLLLVFCLTIGISSCNKSDKTIVLVTDETGTKDGYYNELAYNGLKKVADEFDFNLVLLTPKNSSQYESVLKEAVEYSPNLIVISNPDMESAAVAFAKNNTDLDFIFVESNADLNLDGEQDSNNIFSIRFQQSEEGFLSGILAGTLATDHVAFIGANEFNTYIQYESGFRAGVATINTGITVDVIYIKETTDTQQVKDTVAQMIQNGVQVIYTLNQNTGIYAAAQEAGIPVIIYDYDYTQDSDIKEYNQSIVFVAEKKIDEAVYLAVSDYFNGLYKGQIKYYSYADGCIGYEILDKSVVNSDTETIISLWSSEIQNKTFNVPTTRAEISNFSAPQLSTKDQSDTENTQE